jgi:hypothetical protein
MTELENRELLARLARRFDAIEVPDLAAGSSWRTVPSGSVRSGSSARVLGHGAALPVALAALGALALVTWAGPLRGLPGAGGHTAILHALPTIAPPPSGTSSDCDLAGLRGTLAGSAADPWLAWMVPGDGTRVDVKWPPGFTARFAPGLEVLNPAGAVVARAGDETQLGGGLAGDDPLFFNTCNVNGTTYPNP